MAIKILWAIYILGTPGYFDIIHWKHFKKSIKENFEKYTKSSNKLNRLRACSIKNLSD